ncbi:MAG: hypothetical protein JNJ60_00610 [Rhodocyclaceae bacterium]|nr:hypothetical protein [Rhodocyclaceae bacterium]
MRMTRHPALTLSIALLSLASAGSAVADASGMGFFVSSRGSGKGADFGGLAGADRHCQTLAAEAGAGKRTWRAYLSSGGAQPVHARDRIGKGPWKNAKGVVVAGNVEELHGSNNLNKQTALTEKGMPVNGRGDTPNMHDILTGSQPDGTAFSGNEDKTCGNWTQSGEGSAVVGHHDRTGLDTSPPALSWNSSHGSKGCSDDALKATGGAGFIYCFAEK